MKSKALSFCGALLFCLFALLPPARAVDYTLALLPSLPGSFASEAAAINNAGQIAGTTSSGTNGLTQATLWSGGTAVDLGGLGGLNNGASGINSAGVVVGSSWRSSDYFPTAVQWSASPGHAVSPLGQFWSFAYAINDSGTAVGARDRARVDFHPTVFQNGQETYLPLVEPIDRAYYAARAINNAGVIAGNGNTLASTSLAMVWKQGTVQILDTPSGLLSQADGINEAGRIVGSTFDYFSTIRHAALWNGNSRTDLTSTYGLNTLAYDINNLNQVVGQAYTSNGAIHGALWDANGNFVDLNQYLDPALAAQGWEVTNATAINDSGTIVGAISQNGQSYYSRAIVLSVNAVPEPETYAMLLAGLGMLGGVARRAGRR